MFITTMARFSTYLALTLAAVLSVQCTNRDQVGNGLDNVYADNEEFLQMITRRDVDSVRVSRSLWDDIINLSEEKATRIFENIENAVTYIGNKAKDYVDDQVRHLVDEAIEASKTTKDLIEEEAVIIDKILKNKAPGNETVDV